MTRAGSKNVVRVDATSSSGGHSSEEEGAQVQPTCFGFWRKREARPLPVKPAPKAEPSTSAAEDEVRKQSPRQTPPQKSPRGMFGASAIMRSFQAIGIDMMSEPTTSRRKQDARECFQGGGAVDDEPSKILASYASNIYETKPDLCETQALDAELDGDDGAASIEEEDTFGTPSWSVDPHDIYFVSRNDGSAKICRLGKGDYGPVYLGVWQEHEVAIKLARQKPITLKQERRFQSQVARVHALSHPNLVQFMGACCWKGGKRSVLVTEYMDKGDLRRLLNREDLTAKFAWVRYGRTVALDIAQGLAYLHSRGIVHGRLKSTNVLMNKAGVAKICDVALAGMLSHCKDPRIEHTGGQLPTSDASIAPEVKGGAEPSLAADVYSFGVILWELLSMEEPAGNLRPIRTPEEAPAVIAYLVECCLSRDPKSRPTAARIVSIIHGKQ